MNPRDFLDVADALVTGDTEAEWRSAVSRAYYAAFHVARRLFQDCGFAVPRADAAHGYLWLRLANSGHPDVQNTGVHLNNLRRVRNQSDYDLDSTLKQHVAITHVELAGDIIQLLESVANAPAVQTRITDAMKIYERDVLKDVTWQP